MASGGDPKKQVFQLSVRGQENAEILYKVRDAVERADIYDEMLRSKFQHGENTGAKVMSDSSTQS